MLQAYLLGRPRLLLDGVEVPLGGRPKVVPLLGYLLLHRDVVLERRNVANTLWPDADESGARANLRRHLNYVLALLPPASPERPWIDGDGARIRWNADNATRVDVDDFFALCNDPHRLDDALALYRGDLMDGYDEEWLEPLRARARSVYLGALETTIATRRGVRDYAGASAAADRLLRDDPWREDVLRALMEIRREGGDRAGALAEYERFARRLRDELQAQPMPETFALAQMIAADRAPPQPNRAADSLGGSRASVLPFAGRVSEMEALRAHLEAAASGGGGLVTIGGEAGAGKTRLAREFALDAQRRGAQVFSAGTTSPEAYPYEAFVRIMHEARALASALEVVLPSLEGESSAEGGGDLARRRVQLFDATARGFAALALRAPLLLVIEDLHWAGPATLALLEHLARETRSARVAVVATYREDEPGGGVTAMRRRLARDAPALHLALAPLGAQAVAEIVAAVPPGADATELFARSEGNPLVLEELVRGGTAGTATGAAALRDVVLPRLARLSDGARTLAAFGAVVGDAFAPEVLQSATGWREAAVLDALDELIDRRLVAERDDATYGFTHHVVRQLVYEGIDAAQLRRRHRRIAAVLAQTAADDDAQAARLAHHYERGGEPSRAARYYLAAARRALHVFASDEAARYAERALELDDGTWRFEALLLRERIDDVRGERARQTRALEELTVLARSHGDAAAVDVLERKVALANVIGDRRRERVLLALLDRRLRRRADAPARVRFLELRARYLRSINDFPAARDAYAELVAAAEATGDRAVHASARLALADTYLYEGRLAEGRAELDVLRAAVEHHGDSQALVRTLIAFSRAALVQQDYAAMSSFANDALGTARSIGDREGEALALHTLANGFLHTFDTARSREHYTRSLELYERLGHRVGMASISVDIGLFHTELGLLDAALGWYERARRILAEIDFRFVTCVERVNAGYCHRLRGDFAASRDAATDALALARDIASVPLESAALGTLGAAETGLGAHVEALVHLRRAVELRRPAGATPRLGDNLRALAAAALAAGGIEEARRASDEMLALYTANPRLAPQPAEWLVTASEVERAQGRAGAATLLIRQAQAVMRARAASIDDEDARTAYLALPFHRALRARPGATAAPRTRG